MSLERPVEKRTLRAVLGRLIPRDQDVGALDVDVDHYVLSELAGYRSAESTLVVSGLEAIQHVVALRTSTPFAECSARDQDALLSDVEQGRDLLGWPEHLDPGSFFAALVELAHEGFYAGPDSGGTAAPWTMVGYTSRVPGRP